MDQERERKVMSRTKSKKRRPKVWRLRWKNPDDNGRMWSIFISVGNNGCIAAAPKRFTNLVGQEFRSLCSKWENEFEEFSFRKVNMVVADQ